MTRDTLTAIVAARNLASALHRCRLSAEAGALLGRLREALDRLAIPPPDDGWITAHGARWATDGNVLVREGLTGLARARWWPDADKPMLPFPAASLLDAARKPADPVVPATDEEVKRAFRGFPRGREARLTAWRCAGRDVCVARDYAPLLRAGTPSQSAHGSAVVVRDGDGAILALVMPTWAADLSDLVPLGSVESPDAR